MKTTSYTKAMKTLIREVRTNIVTISWREVIDDNIVTKKRNMKAYEALNLVEYINKTAFVSLSI